MASDHLEKIASYAREHGWEIRRQPKCRNLRLIKEGCLPIFVSPFARDYRATKNALAELRRAENLTEERRA